MSENGHGGAREGAGRKPDYLRIDIPKLLLKSYEIQMEFFESDAPIEKKAEFASRFLQKRVGERIELEIEHTIAPAQLETLSTRCIEALKSRLAIST